MSVGTVAAVRRAFRSRADIYHLHDPELLWSIPVLKATGAKVIYDAHEDLPDQVKGKEYIPKPLMPMAVALGRAAVATARGADHVVAATEKIAESFHDGKVTVVRNYPRLDPGPDPDPSNDTRLNQVVYVGRVGVDRGARSMIEAAGDASFPEKWTLEIAGNMSTSLREELSDLAGWQRTKYLGVVSPADARTGIARSKVGLCILKPIQAYMDSLPTKMFEYFAEGAPVIASDFPLWRQIIEEYDCGILVDPERPDQVAQAVARYADDPELWERHSENALKAARESLNWGTQEQELLGVYRRFLEGSV